MPRAFLAIVATLGLTLSACSRKEPIAEPLHEPEISKPAQAVAPTPPASAPTALPAANPAASAGDARLRELVANYLQSDGHGGWRKDEKAATELEKLSTDEVAQIWPLLKNQEASVRRGAAVFLLGQFDEANSQ